MTGIDTTFEELQAFVTNSTMPVEVVKREDSVEVFERQTGDSMGFVTPVDNGFEVRRGDRTTVADDIQEAALLLSMAHVIDNDPIAGLGLLLEVGLQSGLI